jgi:hypothetical protein
MTFTSLIFNIFHRKGGKLLKSFIYYLFGQTYFSLPYLTPATFLFVLFMLFHISYKLSHDFSFFLLWIFIVTWPAFKLIIFLLENLLLWSLLHYSIGSLSFTAIKFPFLLSYYFKCIEEFDTYSSLYNLTLHLHWGT